GGGNAGGEAGGGRGSGGRGGALRRIDGEDDGAPALERSPECQGCRDGGLAAPPAARRHHDAVAGHDLAQRHERRPATVTAGAASAASSAAESCASCSAPNSSTKRNGSSMRGASPTPARRRARLAWLMAAQPLSSVARSATQARSGASPAGDARARARRATPP